MSDRIKIYGSQKYYSIKKFVSFIFSFDYIVISPALFDIVTSVILKARALSDFVTLRKDEISKTAIIDKGRRHKP